MFRRNYFSSTIFTLEKSVKYSLINYDNKAENVQDQCPNLDLLLDVKMVYLLS